MNTIERIERMSTPEPNTGCWLWTGSLGTPGYGTIQVDGRNTLAHRASYEAHVGKIPSGTVVRHKCDTKSCVNPEHLVIGTHSENSFDSARRYPNRYRNFSKIDLKTRIEQQSVPEPNSGCWLWCGSLVVLGYGELIVNGRKMLAHRASYEAHHGSISKGALVLHKCNTRACVNPEHLELGTHRDKMRARTHGVDRQKKCVEPIDLQTRIERLSVPEPNSGCRLWIGTVVKSTGYGEIKVNGKKVSAHRALWIAHHGVPTDGMVVLHKCDVRLCVNLDHLSVGSRQDNSIDMSRKGRGSFNKLTVEQRRERVARAIQTQGPDGLKSRGAARAATHRRTREEKTARMVRINLLRAP